MPGIRRRLLLGGLFAASTIGGCARDAQSAGSKGALELLCWPDGLGKGVVDAAVQQFASRATLSPKILDGEYLPQLTAMLGDGQAPAIAGIKGEDIPSMLPRADLFVDLNTLGADSLQSQYLLWKWRQGSTLDNRLVGFPIDIGPTAMFYRSDLFAKAGLPAEPDKVKAAIPDWAGFITAGQQLRKRLPGVHMIANGEELFALCCQQQPRRFVDESNHYVGDGAHMRTAWNVAVEAIRGGLSAGIPNADKRWSALFQDGKVATDSGAAWHASDIQSAAPATQGKWRVANGAADGANIGGSFLSVPAKGADHALAFEIVKWILSPANQAKMFEQAALFPSAPAAYDMPELQSADPFFGGQVTSRVFAASAAKAIRSYQAPADIAIQTVFIAQLKQLEASGTSPDAAWKAAVAAGRDVAQKNGVLVS